jgi:hypothetical protein
LQTVTDFG